MLLTSPSPEPLLAILAALLVAFASAICLSEVVAIGAVVTTIGAYLFVCTQSRLGIVAMLLGVLTAIAGLVVR